MIKAGWFQTRGEQQPDPGSKAGSVTVWSWASFFISLSLECSHMANGDINNSMGGFSELELMDVKWMLLPEGNYRCHRQHLLWLWRVAESSRRRQGLPSDTNNSARLTGSQGPGRQRLWAWGPASLTPGRSTEPGCKWWLPRKWVNPLFGEPWRKFLMGSSCLRCTLAFKAQYFVTLLPSQLNVTYIDHHFLFLPVFFNSCV